MPLFAGVKDWDSQKKSPLSHVAKNIAQFAGTFFRRSKIDSALSNLVKQAEGKRSVKSFQIMALYDLKFPESSLELPEYRLSWSPEGGDQRRFLISQVGSSEELSGGDSIIKRNPDMWINIEVNLVGKDKYTPFTKRLLKKDGSALVQLEVRVNHTKASCCLRNKYSKGYVYNHRKELELHVCGRSENKWSAYIPFTSIEELNKLGETIHNTLDNLVVSVLGNYKNRICLEKVKMLNSSCGIDGIEEVLSYCGGKKDPHEKCCYPCFERRMITSINSLLQHSFEPSAKRRRVESTFPVL